MSRTVVLFGILAASTLAVATVGPAYAVAPTTPPIDASQSSTGALVDDTADANSSSVRPRIAAMYPNPVARGDPGEFVVVEFPDATDLDGWTLRDDGREHVSLPNETVAGPVAFSLDPDEAARHTDHEVLAPSGHLQLADGGETVELRRNGTLVDVAGYDDAPEAEVWWRSDTSDDGEGRWAPLGATDHEPVVLDDARATAFVLPDDPETPIRRLRDAEDRVLLAGYTFEDERVATELVRAQERGVEVVVAVEASPVGGVTERQAELLDRLVAVGVEVVAFGGEHARYRFHHDKYAVVDDEAIVLTENWKPAGTGGQSSRGWGVVVHGGETAAELAAIFRTDLEWRAAVPWSEYRDEGTFVEDERTERRYPERHETRRVPVESARLLTAPDNAEPELERLVRSADDSLLIVQPSIGGRDDPLLRAALDAARGGAEVRILLSSAWYVEDDNRALADWIDDRAERDGLNVAVRLADPQSRYEKIHAKGVVVDESAVVVGSVNWNTHSLRENREVAVVLEGEEIASYYADVFREDWQGGIWELPVGIAVVVGSAVIGTAVVARRHVRFE